MNYYAAFGSLFFLLHQGKLLWLLNTPVIGLWFRWVLRISGESSSVGRRHITRILPHAIFWCLGDKQVAEFRTHAKFSKRLYYAFRPLWWTLHAWDWCVADRWVPELSFGFATLTKYPDADPETNTVDGYVEHDVGGASSISWDSLIAAAGNGSGDVDTTDVGIFIYCGNAGRDGTYAGLSRGIYLFDTSSLTSVAVISSAVLSLYGSSKSDEMSASPNIDIYTSAPASNTGLVSGDFDSLGSTSQTGSPITYAGYSTAGYNAFTFNSTGIGNVSKTGISKYGSRNANYDVAASGPSWAADAILTLLAYAADNAGTSNDPKLVVTYALAAVTGTATASITEADIVTGGKTIIITLDGDEFIA